MEDIDNQKGLNYILSKLVGWLKRLFRGRLNRINFFVGCVAGYLVSFLNSFINIMLFSWLNSISGRLENIVDGLASLLVIITPYISALIGLLILSLCLRRHHDIDQGIYHMLGIMLVIFVLLLTNKTLERTVRFIYLLFLVIIPGNNNKNNYGDRNEKRSWKEILCLGK